MATIFQLDLHLEAIELNFVLFSVYYQYSYSFTQPIFFSVSFFIYIEFLTTIFNSFLINLPLIVAKFSFCTNSGKEKRLFRLMKEQAQSANSGGIPYEWFTILLFNTWKWSLLEIPL